MGKLQGKIAVVTGGNSGIGLAAAEALVSFLTSDDSRLHHRKRNLRRRRDCPDLISPINTLIH